MLLAFLFLTFFTAQPGPNVRCIIPGPPTAELSQASAVFTAKVVGRNYLPDTMETLPGNYVSGDRLVILLKVDRVWKGEVGEEVTMYTQEFRVTNGLTWTMAEDFRFENDKQYLIFAYGKMERLSTTACNRTRELGVADTDIKELGESHKPKPSKQIKI